MYNQHLDFIGDLRLEFLNDFHHTCADISKDILNRMSHLDDNELQFNILNEVMTYLCAHRIAFIYALCDEIVLERSLNELCKTIKGNTAKYKKMMPEIYEKLQSKEEE